MICGICGRTLKGTKSAERGYGPICYQKIKPRVVRKSRTAQKDNVGCVFDDEDYAVPGQMELSEFIEIPERGSASD